MKHPGGARVANSSIRSADTLRHTVSKYGVDDGARTHDNWNHNPGLYQLSYAHHYYYFATTRLSQTTPAGSGRWPSNRAAIIHYTTRY